MKFSNKVAKVLNEVAFTGAYLNLSFYASSKVWGAISHALAFFTGFDQRTLQICRHVAKAIAYAGAPFTQSVPPEDTLGWIIVITIHLPLLLLSVIHLAKELFPCKMKCILQDKTQNAAAEFFGYVTSALDHPLENALLLVLSFGKLMVNLVSGSKPSKD